MNRWTRRGRFEHALKRRAAPYFIVDDGRESHRPLIKLVRNCATSEVAHIVRALSTQVAGDPEPVATCRVDLAGFKMTNDLGRGVTVARPS